MVKETLLIKLKCNSQSILSVGSFATQDVITTVLSRVSVSDGMNVEEIQNQVEVALMAEHYYSVAKAYMLYRQKHLEDREVRDKLKFCLTIVTLPIRQPAVNMMRMPMWRIRILLR